MEVSAEVFKAGMRRLAASVCVIGTGDGRRQAGLTATAVMSLTAEPPQLGVAVNRTAGAFGLLRETGVFSVNVLAEAQVAIAVAFSTGTEEARRDRFAGTEWQASGNGAPALTGAAACFVCRVAQQLELSTHVLFVGVVEQLLLAPDASALLHADGQWAGLTKL